MLTYERTNWNDARPLDGTSIWGSDIHCMFIHVYHGLKERKSVMPLDKIAVKVEETYPPSVWVCPSCGTKITTHVPTYRVECRATKHLRKLIYMEVKK